MIASYRRHEMIGAAAGAAKLEEVMTELREGKRERAVVVSNDEIAAVILPVADYEYMAEVVDFVEHLAIYDMVTKRRKSGGRKVPVDRLLKATGTVPEGK